MCGCLLCSLLGIRPATQACALNGNQTSGPLVCRPTLNPLSHSSEGKCNYSLTRGKELVLLPGRNKVLGQIKQGGGLDSARRPYVCHLCSKSFYFSFYHVYVILSKATEYYIAWQYSKLFNSLLVMNIHWVFDISNNAIVNILLPIPAYSFSICRANSKKWNSWVKEGILFFASYCQISFHRDYIYLYSNNQHFIHICQQSTLPSFVLPIWSVINDNRVLLCISLRNGMNIFQMLVNDFPFLGTVYIFPILYLRHFSSWL